MNGRTNSSDVTIQEINYGALIPLEAPTNLVLTPLNARVDITWTDPVDKVASPGGEDVALWDRTVIIRKAGSAPTGPDDGELIYTETTRNQHQYDVYSDTNNVINNTVYYYAVYAYTEMDVPSEPIGGNCKPIAGTPVYRDTLGVPSYGLMNNIEVGEYGGSFHDKAIYAGGRYNISGSGYYYGDIVWSYNASLTKSQLDDLATGRMQPSYAYTDSNCLAAGGYRTDAVGTIDVYNRSLTHSSNVSLSTGRYSGGSGHYRGYAIFAGGYSTWHGGPVVTVDAFDDNLSRTSIASLSSGNADMGTSSNDNHIIFAGGRTSIVEAYSSTLTKSYPTELSKIYSRPGAASIDNYNVFIMVGNIPVEAYDQSLSKISGGIFPAQYTDNDIVSIQLGSYILALKQNGMGGEGDIAVMFDSSLTCSVIDEVNLPEHGLSAIEYYGATKIDNKYALFGINMSYFEAV